MPPWEPRREELVALWGTIQGLALEVRDLTRDVAAIRRRLDLHHPNPDGHDQEDT